MSLDDAIAEMWQRFAPLARERVEVLERYVAALDDGRDDPDLRAQAHAAAHKLAGALGTYQRPGSHAASRLEVVLGPSAPAPEAGEVRPLVAALRAAVDG